MVMAQARGMGIESIFIGGDGWDEPEKLLGTLDDNTPLEGSYFVRDFSAESPDATPFVEAYTTMFMMPPDGPAAGATMLCRFWLSQWKTQEPLNLMQFGMP